MKKAKHTRPVSISMSPDAYQKILAITDEEQISVAEWFRKVADQALHDLKEQESCNAESRVLEDQS